MGPGDGAGSGALGVDAKVGRAAVVFLAYFDDGVAELVAEDDGAVEKGRGYDSERR